MSNQKTKSLTLASDPVARLRELSELDNPLSVLPSENERNNAEAQQRDTITAPHPSSAAVHAPDNHVVLKRSNAQSSQHASEDTLQHSSIKVPARSSEEAPERGSDVTPTQRSTRAMELDSEQTDERSNAETQRRARSGIRNRVPMPVDADGGNPEDPVRTAMLHALRQAYTSDLSRGPSTATTIRIPTEIWLRLDMACTLENQTKQDIIAEALKNYLRRIGRGET